MVWVLKISLPVNYMVLLGNDRLSDRELLQGMRPENLFEKFLIEVDIIELVRIEILPESFVED